MYGAVSLNCSLLRMFSSKSLSLLYCMCISDCCGVSLWGNGVSVQRVALHGSRSINIQASVLFIVNWKGKRVCDMLIAPTLFLLT